MPLTLLGLGPGDPEDLTRRAWAMLAGARVVILRTAQHPCVPYLPSEPTYRACDDLYDAHDRFEDVYRAIVQRVLAEVEVGGEVIYAVPGDPFVAESTVQQLLAHCRQHALPVSIVSGVSFIEVALSMVGQDAIDGLQVVDALAIAARHHPPLDPDAPALVGQVYSRAVASGVKLTLMNQYPDDFAVTLVQRAGTPFQRAQTLPLHTLDQHDAFDHLTALFVPAWGGRRGFAAFQEVIAHLRAPEGCPWDREQTHSSLRPYVLEEAFEVVEAIAAGDATALADELGDLLLQVVLHAQIGTEDGTFTMADVLHNVSAKMIRRHPHVWGDVQVGGSGDVLTNWEALKAREKAASGAAGAVVVDGVADDVFPALSRAHKLQKAAAKVGFDWPDAAGPLAKLHEEIAELQAAPDADARLDEAGDVLFALVNWLRWLKVDPEAALVSANAKFTRRFADAQQQAAAAGRTLTDYDADGLDVLWRAAKAHVG